jgi:hypothetical protein
MLEGVHGHATVDAKRCRRAVNGPAGGIGTQGLARILPRKYQRRETASADEHLANHSPTKGGVMGYWS